LFFSPICFEPGAETNKTKLLAACQTSPAFDGGVAAQFKRESPQSAAPPRANISPI